MTTLNLLKIKEELLNFIRNGDVFTIAQRSVTTKTDPIVGIAGSTITLTNDGVKNIRSVTIDSVLQELYVDYDINIMNKDATQSKIITTTDPLVGGENIVVVYDYSSGDEKIYPDFPEDYLTISAFPRIGFQIDSIASTNRSSTDTLIQQNLLINFIVIAQNKDVDNYEDDLYKLIFNNRKNFECNNLLRPSGRSSKENYKSLKTTVLFHKMFSFTAPAEFIR